MVIVHERDVDLIPSPNGNRTNGLITRARGAIEMSLVRQIQESGGFNPPHYHDHEEVMIVRGGVVAITLDDETTELTAGDVLLIPAHTVHQLRNIGSSAAEWLLVTPSGTRFYRASGEEITPSWDT